MGNHRPYNRKSTKELAQNNAPKDENGRFIDPNTKEAINGKPEMGHDNGMENHGFIKYSDQAGMSQAELNDTVNNGGLYRLEDSKNNRSHKYESQDSNQTALTTSNYCYLENPQYQKNTYICPPVEEGGEWSVQVENKNTGVVEQVGTFYPDFSNNMQTQYDSLDDFGSSPQTTDVSQSNTQMQSNSLDNFGVSDSNNDINSSNSNDLANSNENSL